ncbi:hypothetical protein [Kitasatospora atroaurantiaca]|uniref:hypothetical protein n=1 Tax=Kitasatospora atroaurantiaca TaxID=285545 RepID=UPI001BABF6CB|nr:hypothetical protein [Kitasatospora atroaurantiaca]
MTARLVVARQALHAVAELLLAGPQYRASGTIRLRVQPGGFATVAEPALRVEGAELVAGDRRLALQGATCTSLGDALGIEAGAPAGLYAEGSGADPTKVLSFDPAAAGLLLGRFAEGDTALRLFAPDQQPVLWPEHFDLGITVDEVNYGVSPGDAYSREPYAYVGPWTRRDGDFWNAPFGATRPMSELAGADAIAAFFAIGRDRARIDPPAKEA